MVSYKTAEWIVASPAGISYEDTTRGMGVLATDLTENFDGRFEDIGQLGPLPTSIDLSGSDGGSPSVTNVRGGDFSGGLHADEKLALIRGIRLALIKLSDRTSVTDGTATAFAANARHIFYSRSATGTEELSVGIDGDNDYLVVTAVPNTGGYTFTANNQNTDNHYFGSQLSRDAAGVVFALGRTTAGIENILRSNAISGAVTMDASAWATRATISVQDIDFTGPPQWWGNFMYIPTTAGPLWNLEDFQVFQPLMPSLTPSANNCKGSWSWEKAGVFIPLERETRLFVGQDSESVGPERFPTNTSLLGRMTAGAASDLWGYAPIYNPRTDQTYLCALRPRTGFENYIHSQPISYYPIIKLAAGVECEFVRYSGLKGGVTNPTVWYGIDDDVAWFLEGRDARFPDDSNTRYNTAGGSWLGTELRRDPDTEKRPVCVMFEAEATTTETIAISFTYRDRNGTTRTEDVGTVRSSGPVVWEVPRDEKFESWRFAPKLTLATGASTTTPRIKGTVKVIYEETSRKDKGMSYFDFERGMVVRK